MLFRQTSNRPVQGKMTGVPDPKFIGIHADLDREAAGVVFVGHCVEDGLAQGLLGDGIGFHSLHTIIGYQGLEILGPERFEGFIDLTEEIAMNFIMENKVGIRAEEADLDVSPGEKSLRIGVKEEDCGAFQVRSIHEMKLFQKTLIRFLKNFGCESLAAQSALAEGRQGNRIEVGLRNIWHRHPVPIPTLLAQKKTIQRRTFQLLLRAAAPVVVFPLVTNRIGIRFNNNLDEIATLFLTKVHIDQNPEHITDLVWKFLQQFLGIFYSDRNAFVIFPDDKGSSARVRKSRNPLQIFVTPGFFPFDGLVFGHFKK